MARAAKRSDKVPGDKVPGLNTGQFPEVILSLPASQGIESTAPEDLRLLAPVSLCSNHLV